MKAKLLLTLISLVLIATPMLQPFQGTASALSGSSFQAGNIISDSIFYNGTAMSSSQIQSFLNAKVPTCDTNGTKPSGHSGYPTRADWGRHNGYPPPYTCLKSYKQNTPAVNAESLICDNLSAKTGRSAALIISDVASACGISPKALIVLLQKEQGLVTDEWPWPSQYRIATGYGCPDTAPCNSEYYGFFNQVYKAAWQFKKYQANPDNYNFVAGQNNNIRWNPSSSCGSKTVFILNQATAGLYNYTPYQPNKAALDNLYGSGDKCSAYGNRNFWRYFNDWFGTTWSSPFFRIGNTDAVYVLGSNNNYYHVPSSTVLYDYGYKRAFPNIIVASNSYVSGKTNSGELPSVARFEGSAIYQLENGTTHHFTSGTQYGHFGHIIGDEALLPSWIYDELVESTDMQQVVRQSSAPEVYYVQNGKKSHIINGTAFTTMGSPAYSSQPSVTLRTANSLGLPDGAPIMPANTTVHSSDTGAYGIWNGSNLQQINAGVFKNLAISPDYTAKNYALNQLSKATSTLASLAKDSGGHLFILDSAKKFSVNTPQLTTMGFAASDFVTTADALLSRVPSSPMQTLFRVNNSTTVYSLLNGSTHRVFSGDDFIGLGYSWANVISVNPVTYHLFSNSSTPLFKQGRLLRHAKEAAVYLVDGQFKRKYIPSSATLHQYGYNINSVVSVDGASLYSYMLSGNLSQVVKDGAGVFWLVDSAVRHKISTTLLGASYYNINQTGTLSLSSENLASLATSTDLSNFIRVDKKPEIYKVENGKKRWCTTRASFESNGGDWNQISTLSAAYVASLPRGPSL
ncbi:hypothetical protein BH09PAT4_BH09PAT4_03070 [soil metagenome]